MFSNHRKRPKLIDVILLQTSFLLIGWLMVLSLAQSAEADGGESYGWTTVLTPSEVGSPVIPDVVEYSYDPGSPSETIVYATDYDADQNLIAGGRFNATVDFDPSASTVASTSGTYADAFLAKYSPVGNLIWRIAFGGERIDSINDLKVDTSGNIYVVGQFRGTVDFDPSPTSTNNLTAASGLAAYDMFLAKFTSLGQLVWVVRHGIAVQPSYEGDLGTVGTAVEIDSDGNIWSLVIQDDQIRSKTILYKYSPTGTLLNSMLWNFGLGFDLAKASGRVYLAGSFGGNSFDLDPTSGTDIVSQEINLSDGDWDGFIVALSNDGSYLWGREVMDLASQDALVTYGFGVAVDGDGNVYVTGNTFAYYAAITTFPFDNYLQLDESQGAKAYLVSYSSSGTKRFSVVYGHAYENYENGSIYSFIPLHMFFRPAVSPNQGIFVPGWYYNSYYQQLPYYSNRVLRFSNQGAIEETYPLPCQLPRQVSFNQDGDMGFGGRMVQSNTPCSLSPAKDQLYTPQIPQGFVTQYENYVLNRYPLTVHVSKPLADSVAGMGFNLSILEGPSQNAILNQTGIISGGNQLWGAGFSVNVTQTPYPMITLDKEYYNIRMRGTTNQEIVASVPLTGVISESNDSPLAGVTLSDPLLGTRTTNSQGRYEWSDTPLGQSFVLTLSKPGFTFLHPYFEGTTGLDYGLSTIGTLLRHDLVMNIPPIPFDVTITSSGGQFDPLVITAGESYTNVSDLPWGSSFSLSATSPHYTFSPSSLPVVMDSDKEVSFTSATLKTYQLTGRVFSSSTGALSGVLVNGGSLGQVQTNSSGQFSFAVQALHDYSLNLSKSAFYILPPTTTGRMTSNFDLQFNYKPECWVRGRVTINSLPLSSVQFSSNGYGVSRSDSTGQYAVGVPCGENITVRPSLGGYTFSPPTFQTTASISGSTYNVSATRSNTVSGMVFYSGSGLGGVTVTPSGGSSVSTDQTGAYLISSIADGSNYTIVPSKTGYVFNPSAASGKLDMPRMHNFTATKATYYLKGTVLTEGGTPLPGVSVSSGTELITSTNSTGSFIFPAVVHGKNYSLFFSLRGYRFAPAIVNGQLVSNTNVNIVAYEDSQNEEGKYSLSGFVFGVTGPISGVQVQVNSSTTMQTDDEGRFSVSLPQGSAYTVNLSKTGYFISPAYFSGSLNENTSIAANALSQCSISGTVLLDGRGLQSVTLSTSTGSSTSTDAFGNYLVELSCGQLYQLTPSRAGHTFSPSNFSGQVSEPTTAIFNATSKLSVEGTVSIAGVPASGVTVDGGNLGKRTTDLYGRFSFKDLPRYTYYTLRPGKDGVNFSPVSSTGQLVSSATVDFGGAWKTYTIRGKVLVGGTEPVAGVQVVSDRSSPVVTNTSGDFSFPALPYGTRYTLSFAKDGYDLAPTTINGELKAGVFLKVSATKKDRDKDGVADIDEAALGTDPLKADSDGDGVTDGQELSDGSSPTDSGSHRIVIGTEVCSEWNGYLGGMMNVMEHVAAGGTKIRWTTNLFGSTGVLASTGKYAVAGGAQFDIIANQLPGFALNSYGRLCSKLTEGRTGSLDGRMVYYKTGSDGRYQFAVAMPFSVGEVGAQAVEWNTVQLASNAQHRANLITNWIQVTNLGTAKERGVVSIHRENGTVLWSGKVTVNPGGRLDIQGHRATQSRGLVLWKPESKTTRFLVRSMRYYYDNSGGSESFSTAYQIEARPGAGQQLFAPFDATEHVATLDLGNVTAQEIAVEVKAYEAKGALLKSMSVRLSPLATATIDLAKMFAGKKGLVAIKGNKANALVAVVTQAILEADGSLKNAVGLPAMEALGTELKGSYNTFLGQSCTLLLLNSEDKTVGYEVSMRGSDGTSPLSGYKAQLAAKGTADIKLCEKGAANTYGTVTVVSEDPHSLVGLLVRLGANGDYRIPTPVR